MIHNIIYDYIHGDYSRILEVIIIDYWASIFIILYSILALGGHRRAYTVSQQGMKCILIKLLLGSYRFQLTVGIHN